jgi:GT2 family glycosyltransferase
MLIRAVIVNFNGYQDTIECLASLKSQIDVKWEPLILDNGSSNDSVSQIKAAHPNVEMLVMDTNLGFSGGNNVAIKHVLDNGCDYVFLVNNDTTMEPDCLRNLLECAKAHPDAAVITPAIYLYSDQTRPWFTGSAMNIAEGIVTNKTDDVRTQNITRPFDTAYANGCAMLVRAEVMRKLGGFDERFFCYWEDTDWSFRAKEQGYRCLVCPTAILYHKVSSTIKKKSNHLAYYMTRNQLLFVSKHAAAKDRRYYLRQQTSGILRRTMRIFYNRAENTSRRGAIACLVGAVDFHRQRFGRCRHSWL